MLYSEQRQVQWHPVEKRIEGLGLTHSHILYNDDRSSRITIDITQGTRVNTTCTIDDEACLDFGIDWENLSGMRIS